MQVVQFALPIFDLEDPRHVLSTATTWSLDVEHVVETHSLTVFYNPMIAVPAMYGATPMVRTGAKGAGSEGSLVPRPN